MPTPPPKQSRVSGALAVTIAQAVVLLLGYITHPIVGVLLGSQQYGIYGVVLSIQSIIGIFLTLGIPSAVSRFVAQDEKNAHGILLAALKIQSYLAISLGASTMLLSPLVAAALGDTSLTPYVAFIGIIITSQAFYPVFVQYFSGQHKFTQQALLTIIYAVSKLAGSVLLIFIFGVYGALAGFAIGGILAALFGWFWSRSHTKASTYKIPIKKFLSFAGAYVFILASLQLLMSLDLFMVKAFLKSNQQAGYYSAASTIARISYFLLQGLTFILLPSVSTLTKSGQPQAHAKVFIQDTLRYLIALIIPGVALAATTSKPLIQLFYGNDYLSAAPALTVLMVGLGALAFYLLIATILAGAGKAKVALRVTLLLLVISAILGTFLIPSRGLIGAAWQTTSTALIGLAILSAYTFKTFKITPPIKSTINIIIASTVAILPTYIWKVGRFMLPLQYLVLLGLYLAVLMILREITLQDRQLLAKVHPRLKWVAS